MGDVAYIVENDVLLHAILNEIEHNENVTIRNDTKIDKVLLERDGYTSSQVFLKSGENFSAELLVRETQCSQQCSINKFIFSV